MMKVEQIKTAIMNLSWAELDAFREWYKEFKAHDGIDRLRKIKLASWIN
jgi:hypothetical protein